MSNSKKKKKKNNNYYALEKKQAREREYAYYQQQKAERRKGNVIFVIGLILAIVAMIFAIIDLVDKTTTHQLIYGLTGGVGFLAIGVSFLETRKTYAIICAGIGIVMFFSCSNAVTTFLQSLF